MPDFTEQLQRLESAEGLVGVDTETDGRPMRDGGELRGISFYHPVLDSAIYIPLTHPNSENYSDTGLIRRVLENPGLIPIFHNAPFDCHVIKTHLDVDLWLRYEDSMVTAFLTNENNPRGLKPQSEIWLGGDAKAEKEGLAKLRKSRKWKEDEAWALYTYEDIASYAAQDAKETYDLWAFQHEKIIPKLPHPWYDAAVTREYKLRRMVHNMVERGIGFDSEQADEMAKEMSEAAKRIRETHFPDTNPKSPKQLQKLLYDDLGLPCYLETPSGGRSTSADALEPLGGHEVVAALLEYRGLTKEVSTYLGPLSRFQKASSDGLIHSDVLTYGTVTGRFSSSKPNLQNLPREDTAAGVKKLFRGIEDGHELWEYDLQSAELFVGASICRDEKMLATLTEPGRDMHTETAVAIFGSADGRYRTLAKNANYGCVPPDTLILTDDLRWVRAGDLAVGDGLTAFDESGPWRSWKTGTVTHTGVKLLPSVEIIFDDGTKTVCSDNHPWLVRSESGKDKKLNWKTPDQLAPGDGIGVMFPKTWQQVKNYNTAWLAGIFDGEGHLSSTKGSHLTLAVSQNEGYVLDKIRDTLDQLKVQYHAYEKGTKCKVVTVMGGRINVAQVLGTIRPIRLLNKFQPEMLGRVRSQKYRKVVSVTDVGLMPMVTLSTSTKTYVADGMCAHNSFYGMGAEKFSTYIVKGSGEIRSSKHVHQAQIILNKHRATWSNMYAQISKLEAFAREHKYAPLVIRGRNRHFHGWNAPNPKDAYNAMVQGGVAETMKSVMIELEYALPEGSQIVMQVHDSLLVSQPPGVEKKVLDKIQEVTDDLDYWRARLTWDAKQLS